MKGREKREVRRKWQRGRKKRKKTKEKRVMGERRDEQVEEEEGKPPWSEPIIPL